VLQALDLTDNARPESAHRHESRFRGIIETPATDLAIDASGCISYANPGL
jgi:hypothetical protein